MENIGQDILSLAREHGINDQEFETILQILGRIPTITEIGMYSVMWSEHCSYKNSIAEIKKLPKTGKHILISAGEENAGLIDIGENLAIAFKIESHNHPSAIEPYQGAATGVGGIMRDIFTMGARPIACLNSLRFGNPLTPRTQYLLRDVVKGIGDYSNSFGVPTVAGDIFFDDSYNENPIVNAMAVGIVEQGKIARGKAIGEGNLVVIVGSSTGRDGIHGATFASDELSEKSGLKRPSVQVGDPFTEKLLLEATLEAIHAGLIVGIQDMGAAGITCSTTEMCARGLSGMDINLDNVPVRENGMSAYEIMLSESQERMLVVVKPEHEAKIKGIFNKWELHCEVIGRVISPQEVRISMDGTRVASVPAQSFVLGGGAPIYHRESTKPGYLEQANQFDQNVIHEPQDYTEAFLTLLASPNICSRKWVYEQYDTSVRTNTINHGISDAGVIRIKGTKLGLAIKTDCNPRYSYLNPYLGGILAVAEAARNVACTGARPLAVTNCLNFGNPYDPEVFYQFKESIRGIGEACRILGTPVTGGNVSFYNESPQGSIFPTPVIGMLGLLEDIDFLMTPEFKHPGDIIILFGTTRGHIGGTEYLKLIHNRVSGDAPPISLNEEKNLQNLVILLISKKLVYSVHDLSEGGLSIAIAESAAFSVEKGPVLGATVIMECELRSDFYLFGEDQSRIIVSCKPQDISKVFELAREFGIPANVIGEVIPDRIIFGNRIDLTVSTVSDVYENSFPFYNGGEHFNFSQ